LHALKQSFYLNRAKFYRGPRMGTQLNIKSEDAYRLASCLAELTGESLTSVVTKALRAELERTERNRSPDAEAERMLAMGREIRRHMRQPITSDHSSLYDENGFPK
jgi:antitoxin VapB